MRRGHKERYKTNFDYWSAWRTERLGLGLNLTLTKP